MHPPIMHLFRHALTVLLLSLLAACAQPTPYHPANDVGQNGYGEEMIGADQYKVRFQGNGITTRKTVDLYLLYRAAELAEENGFDYFIVGDRREFINPLGIAGQQSQISFARRQELLIGSGIRARFGEEVVDQYGAEIDVLMQKGERPDTANAHRAVDVIERSKKAIVRPANQVQDPGRST
ncbi:MAG: CC0125/CC1285 family lipoprotein [Geminicoccaceae bacterium]